MSFSPLIEQLIHGFRCLPGVGLKSAQRMTLHLLERDRPGGQQLIQALDKALEKVKHCQQCRNLSETDICLLCANQKRQVDLLCVVESPIDVLAIEQMASFRGRYFVLMGHLSPLDGIGPNEIGIPLLLNRLQQDNVAEVIIATNPTVEGEATAHYIAQHCKKHQVKATRIAHGVPLGGELEYIDAGTLAHAFSGRIEI